MQVLVRDNNVDQALKALKKKMQREGIFREMKLRGHYEKPSEKKAREKAEAVRRARKLARKKLQREGLLPMKPKPAFGAGPGGDRGPGGGGRGGPGGVPAVRADPFQSNSVSKTRALRSALLFLADVLCGAAGYLFADARVGERFAAIWSSVPDALAGACF